MRKNEDGSISSQTEKQMNQKTRDQSILSYFNSLQIEYIICMIRSKVYTKTKDKVFYRKTMKFKETKISDIALRNRISSIFDSSDAFEEFRFIVCREKGYPNFVYKDQRDREENESKDFRYYYSEGSDVKVTVDDNNYVLGVVISAHSESKTVEVRLKGSSEPSIHSITNVTRIL